MYHSGLTDPGEAPDYYGKVGDCSDVMGCLSAETDYMLADFGAHYAAPHKGDSSVSLLPFLFLALLTLSLGCCWLDARRRPRLPFPSPDRRLDD
jgi:hypothetical protein